MNGRIHPDLHYFFANGFIQLAETKYHITYYYRLEEKKKDISGGLNPYSCVCYTVDTQTFLRGMAKSFKISEYDAQSLKLN